MVDWLPEEVGLSNSLDDDYKKLYAIFQRDFIRQDVYFCDEKIIFQKAIDKQFYNGSYPCGFTHIVTRKIDNTKERIIDYERAKRLPWIKAIIENHQDPAVLVLRDIQFSKKNGKRHIIYLWLEEEKFVVILSKIRRKNDTILLLTAYTITEPYMEKKLRKIALRKV